KPYSGLLILADEYPQTTTLADGGILERASEVGLRTYIEFPSHVPDLKVGKPAEVRWERGIIATDFFEPRLEEMSILDLHKCSYVSIDIPDPIMVLGRVAGLNRAVYGLPEHQNPLLARHPRLDLLIGTTKLSNFATGRYSPADDWGHVWQAILGWLTGGRWATSLDWRPGVTPAYSREEALPAEVELEALERGLNWFTNSGLLGGGDGEGVDGSSGLMEGFSSLIDPDGGQTMNRGLRADCNGEGAGAMSLGKIIRNDHPGCQISENIIEYLFEGPVFSQGPRKDPASPSYGLISWGASPPADSIYYGDDNARCLLGMIEASAVLGLKRFNAGILRCILANFRTTGSRGFRGWRLEEKDLQERGWRHYFRRRVTLFAPHYEAYLWACYLWAYRETGYRPFLTRALRAIDLTMKQYPEGWKWTNGIAQERARMLLPLAWLVQVQDKPLHREWLTMMGREVISLQDKSGALREELGGPGKGSYGPPRSNEDYGKHEATLMQKNGDPICDMLYTTNFAFLGLHEAATASGDELFIGAEDKLAEFLCRIQTRSEKHPELDGAWYRGFDFSRWDYWGSNADAGWGVWSIESGWTQGWIVSVLGLRRMGLSLWDLSEGSGVKDHLDVLLEGMMS
ncbi:MAG: hypothetical protein HXS50_01410, partial [Theionarchaea archaeon]|nr:hypothetical protein [Theionarchaea archaeon]